MSWLPERRNGYWYDRHGRCVEPDTWREWRITHLMAIHWIFVTIACLAGFASLIIGYNQLWIWYPALVTPMSIAISSLVAAICLIASVAQEITR